MHQSSDSYLMPLLQNEDTVITSGRAEQYSNRGHIPCSLTSFSLGWGIYFWHSNERGPVTEAQPFLLWNPTSQKPLAMLPRVDTSQPLGGSSPSDYTFLCVFIFFFFFLSSQKWLFRYGPELAGWNVGFLKPHRCFSCVP